MTDSKFEYRIGSRERIGAVVETDHVLDEQSVEISIDGQTTWHEATWEGEPGMTRRCTTTLPVTIAGPARYAELLIRVDEGDTDVDERPIIGAGAISIVV